MQYVNDVHLMAWDEGLKSLYYLRTTASKRPDDITTQATRKLLEINSEHSLASKIKNGLSKLFMRASTALAGSAEVPVEETPKEMMGEEIEGMEAVVEENGGECESCQG